MYTCTLPTFPESLALKEIPEGRVKPPALMVSFDTTPMVAYPPPMSISKEIVPCFRLPVTVQTRLPVVVYAELTPGASRLSNSKLSSYFTPESIFVSSASVGVLLVTYAPFTINEVDATRSNEGIDPENPLQQLN